VLSQSQVNGNTAIAPPGAGGPPLAAGGTANGGDAVLNSTQVDHNTTTCTNGAEIVNHGTMTLNKSEVNGNTTAGTDLVTSGAGSSTPRASGAVGSAILTLNNSQVNNNSAGSDGAAWPTACPCPARSPLSAGPSP